MKDFEKQIDAYLVEQQERAEQRRALKAEQEAIQKTDPVRALAIDGELELLTQAEKAAAAGITNAFREKDEHELEAIKPAFTELHAEMDRVRGELVAVIDKWPLLVRELRTLVERRSALVKEANQIASRVGRDFRSPTDWPYEIRPVIERLRTTTNGGIALKFPMQ